MMSDRYICIVMCVTLLLAGTLFAAEGKHRWQTISSVKEVVAAYPQRMRSLIEALDLQRPELAQVREAHEAGDLVAACEALLTHYRESEGGSWLRGGPDEVGDRARERADHAVADRFTQQRTTDRVPRGEDGHLDWTYEGPVGDLQFAVFLNRHHYFPSLVATWHATGEDRYAAAVDRLVKDWVLAHGTAPEKPEPHAVWTPLNPGIRMSGPWPRAFYGLQRAEGFTPAARLLLLYTVPEHARFLQDHLHAGHNFATMQMNGLGTIGAAFPEFKRAGHWRDFAVQQVLREFEMQVYPDGVQKELAATYHWVALTNFERLAESLRGGGFEVPEAYREQLVQMYDYMADAMRPDGSLPLNNDSDGGSMMRRILQAADQYDREAWRYIATNGEAGTRPADPPSRAFPWAGQMISRSGWARDSHWSFFDVGPYGISHQHNDANHLSVHVFGRDVLVDSGRFAYQGEIADKFRKPYTFHSRAHNVILLDGMGQQANQPETQQPHPWLRVTPEADLAMGTFSHGYDSTPTDAVAAWNGLDRHELVAEQPGRHSRAVFCIKDRGWIVFDQMEARGKHTISPLWHFHPDCTVVTEGEEVVSVDPAAGNLRITPTGPVQWDVKLVKGQEKPTLQGWYSPTYGEVHPAFCAVYSGEMTDTATFGWVMTPAMGLPEAIDVEWLDAPQGAARMRVTWPDGGETLATVAFEQPVDRELGGGTRFVGHGLVETDGHKTAVLGGRLLDAAGRVIDAHTPTPEAVIGNMLSRMMVLPAAPRTSQGVFTFRIPLANATLPGTLRFEAEPAQDNGAGWTIDVSPPKVELEPGKSQTVTLTAHAATGEPRYPLPDVNLRAALTSADREEAVSIQRRMWLPVLGTQPALPAQRVTNPPKIDGSVTDAAWKFEPTVARFGSMKLERELDPATATAAWVGYDETSLYVAFRCREPNMDSLKLQADEHDAAVWRDDSVEVLLDPGGDGSSYYQFMVNAAGVTFDGRKFDKGVNVAGFEAAAARGEDQWTAEFAIPWAGLGLDGPPEHPTLLLARTRRAGGQPAVYQFPVSPKGNHRPEYFGTLLLHEQDRR